MAQNNRHEAKGADDGQHRKIFLVAGQNILPPVQRLQVIDKLARQGQKPAGPNREKRWIVARVLLFPVPRNFQSRLRASAINL